MNRMMRAMVAGVLCGLFLLAGMSAGTAPGADAPAAGAAAGQIDFARDVQPMLVAHCYECHGPVTQKSKLRWDRRESVMGRKDPIIIAGRPDESELIRLVADADPDEMMPPQGKGEPLSPDQVATLRKWIEQGAPWPDEAAEAGDARLRHWSFQRPVRPKLPAVKNGEWPRNGVDRSILARLEKEGLSPSPEADRYTLIRRLSLDLTGLPPTVEEVEAFVNDKGVDAYEKLVDRLLASPALGERWAQVWLDLARYADSKGYAEDNPRTIWRYRDWVIEAINANLPYDRFTIEQIAGDLLPDATERQLLATAFNRNTLTNDEGGTDDEEFRVAAVVDRVNTTMQVWMGMTVACAQCHDHKYDPITQEEFFRLYAIFNNTEDSDKHDDNPNLMEPIPQQRDEVQRLREEVAVLHKEMAHSWARVDAEQAKWEAQVRGGVSWRPVEVLRTMAREGTTLAAREDGSVLASGDLPANETYVMEAAAKLKPVTAVRLEAIADESLPGGGPGRAENGSFILSRFIVETVEGEAELETATAVKIASAVADFSQKGLEVGHAVENKDVKKLGWGIEPETGKGHWAAFVAQSPVELAEGMRLRVTLEHASEKAGATLGRFRVSVTDDAAVGQKLKLPAEIATIVETPRDEREAGEQERLTKHYRAEVSPTLKAKRNRLAALKKEIDQRTVATPIMRELPSDKARTTHIMLRGNFLEKAAEVSPGVPAVFHEMPDAALDRLSFARWLVDAENPLTARVTVNRFWEQIFGTGLVETSDDFGLRGSPPSHPELLDWLATELVRLNWDTKALLRLVVTSAAYRQTSRVTPELLERDPNNRLLARGPRVRSSAEVIRDQALFASGLLSRKMYGPSVRPVRPKLGLAAAFGGSTDWDPSPGEDRYRRGLYTSWRRSVPYPSMVTFDAPARTVCTLRRPRTNTPLQALVMLNDPVYVEAAQALARRMAAEGGADAESRARYGFRLCVARPPSEAELRRLLGLYEEARSRYAADAEAAVAMATEPIGPLPEGMDAVDLAAWTVVGNVLLNLDETVSKP